MESSGVCAPLEPTPKCWDPYLIQLLKLENRPPNPIYLLLLSLNLIKRHQFHPFHLNKKSLFRSLQTDGIGAALPCAKNGYREGVRWVLTPLGIAASDGGGASGSAHRRWFWPGPSAVTSRVGPSGSSPALVPPFLAGGVAPGSIWRFRPPPPDTLSFG